MNYTHSSPKQAPRFSPSLHDQLGLNPDAPSPLPTQTPAMSSPSPSPSASPSNACLHHFHLRPTHRRTHSLNPGDSPAMSAKSHTSASASPGRPSPFMTSTPAPALHPMYTLPWVSASKPRESPRESPGPGPPSPPRGTGPPPSRLRQPRVYAKIHSARPILVASSVPAAAKSTDPPKGPRRHRVATSAQGSASAKLPARPASAMLHRHRTMSGPTAGAKKKKEARNQSVSPYVECTQQGIDRILYAGDLGPEDTIFDIGCGKGYLLLQALRQYRVRRCVGIELNASLARAAQHNTSLHRDRIAILHEDIRDSDLSEATVVVMYMSQDGLIHIAPHLERKLAAGVRVHSYLFPFPGWREDPPGFSQRPETRGVFRYVMGLHR